MKLLDYSIFPAFLARRFGSPEQRRVRLVGPDRDYDSGYFDITRFFGTDAPDPEEITLRYRATSSHIDDPLIAAYARRIEKELRAGGRLYDGPPTMAVVGEAFDGADPYISVEKCDYGLFAGSCFALDRPAPEFFGRGDTLREYYAATYPDRTPENHPLAGSLGVCGLLVLRRPDGAPESILVVQRAGYLASLEHSTGPSAAGSVDWSTTCRSLGQLLQESLGAEVEEELGLRPGEFAIRPLAFAREIFRGEKPQLLAVIETPLDRAAVEIRIEAVPGRREFDQYRFVSVSRDGRIGSGDRDSLNHEARMNLALLAELWTSGRG